MTRSIAVVGLVLRLLAGPEPATARSSSRPTPRRSSRSGRSSSGPRSARPPGIGHVNVLSASWRPRPGKPTGRAGHLLALARRGGRRARGRRARPRAAPRRRGRGFQRDDEGRLPSRRARCVPGAEGPRPEAHRGGAPYVTYAREAGPARSGRAGELDPIRGRPARRPRVARRAPHASDRARRQAGDLAGEHPSGASATGSP